MSQRLPYAGVVHYGFPRVSGDEPPMLIDLRTPSRFSPRERG